MDVGRADYAITVPVCARGCRATDNEEMKLSANVPGTSCTPLIGRETELAELLGLLDGVAERGAVRLVHGDPGAGKSALLAAVGSSAHDRGMLVLETTGAEFEAQMPFSGLQQLVDGILGEASNLIPAQRDALRDALSSATDAPSWFLVALAALNLLSDCAARARPRS